MTVAIIALALALAGSVGANVWLSRRNETLASGQIAAARMLQEQRNLTAETKAQRDEIAVDEARLSDANELQRLRIAELEHERNEAYERGQKELAERVAAARDVRDVASIVAGLLAQPLGKAPGAS